MNGKIIATILALGMIAGAFAFVATPVSAAAPHGFWFLDLGDGSPVIIAAADATPVDEGAVRHYYAARPAEVNTIVQYGGAGLPYAGTSDVIGLNGAGAGPDYAYVNPTTFPTAWVNGENVIFLIEVDTNAVAGAPNVYVNGGVFNVGAVPNGYMVAGRELMADPPGDSTPRAPALWQIEKMPLVDISADPSITWAGMAGGPAAGNTAAEIVSWELYESAANSGPWTQVGTAAYGAAINYALVANNWYSARVTFTGGVASLVMSEPVENGGIEPNVAPVVDDANTSPAIHNGNTVNEFVTIYANATDSDAGPGATTLEYSLDGGAWTSFVSGATIPFPAPYTEGLHSVDVRAFDTQDYSVATVEADFTITDTTAPLAAWDTVPPSDWYIGTDLTFTATYEDFSDVQAAGSYLTWSLNAVPQANVPFVMTFDGFGSYLYTATATIPTGAMVAGDQVTYGGQVTAASAGPQTTPLAAGVAITLADAPDIINPFAVFGSVVLYDGTSAGGYNPIQAGAGVPVDVTYNDFLLGGLRTLSTTTDATGFYTVDIMNAILADPYGIEIEAGPFTGYNNMGYDSIPVLDYSVTGGILNDVVCGIPYEVVITVPAPLFNTNAGALMATTYVVLDIDGIPAQGYFSFEGAMDWTSTDLAFTNVDGPITFDGVADAGTHTGDLIMMTAGPQTIRIADEDGGVAPPAAVGTNMFLTPWGDFGPVLIGGVSTPVYLDDWDEIIVNVMADQFFWNLVAGGWNLVSAPTDPVDKGLDGNFDADDAMNVCLASNPLNVGLQMATKTGASSYNVVLLGVGEAGAFDIDSVHGYWIFSDVADVVGFYGIDYDIVADPTLNVVTTNAGWNLLGFTHNYNGGVWGAIPTASDFCDGTIGPGMGAATMIIATEWDYAAQWYYSYVNTPTFVMPTRDWAWDFSYAGSPGNGFYLWTEAPIVITFNVVY